MDCSGSMHYPISRKPLLWLMVLVGVLILARRISFARDTSINILQLSNTIQRTKPGAVRDILVTGGLGRVGKAVCSTLIRAGYFVIVLDVSSHLHAFFDELKYQTVDREQVAIFVGDIQNQSIIRAIRKQYSRLAGIIHLATVTREDWCQEHTEDCLRINVNSTQRFLQAIQTAFGCNDENKPWLIYTSSLSICAHSLVSKNESSMPAGKSSLIRSKVNAENVIRTFSHLFSRVIILRLADIYGLFDDYSTRTIPYFVRQAITHNPISLTEPTLVGNYIHVTDVMRVVLELMRTTTERSKYRWTSLVSTFCLSASSIDQKSLLSMVLKITHSQSLVRTMNATEQVRTTPLYNAETDASKFEHLLRYRSIAKGLQQYVDEIGERDLRLAKGLFDKECVKNLVEESDLNNCTVLIYTNIMMRTMLTCQNGNPWRTTNQFSPDFRFVSAKVKNTHGMSGYYIQCQTARPSFLRVTNKTAVKSTNKSVFFFSYVPENRTVALLTYDDKQAEELFSVQLNGSLQRWNGTQHLYFVSPFCCEGRTALPLLWADPLLQQQKELSWYSRPANVGTKCRRLKVFIDQKRRQTETEASPKRVPHTPLCDRDCSLFTGCLLLDHCRCIADRCSARLSSKFDFASRYKSRRISQMGIAQIPFETVLQQRSKAFYKHFDLPRIHVLDVPSTLVPYYNDTNRHRLHPQHCFNVDDIIMRGLKNISTEISDAELIVVPFFHGFYMHYRAMHYSRQIHLIQQLEAFGNRTLVAINSTAKLLFILTHDSGGCIAFAWHHMALGLSSYNYQVSSLRNAYLLQPNGDYNTHCYYPQKDIVIPPFTCLTPDLLAAFRDLHRVKPVSQRRVFAFFKGTVWGSGLATRARLSCPSLWKRTWNRTMHGITLIQRYYNNSDYLTTLNETRFCLTAPGTTGWSSRLIDAVYAGCIPVLIISSTRHPFEDILDYETFSIHVPEDYLDTLEEKLLSYTDDELLIKQRNLLKVRTAFLFENHKNPVEHLHDQDSPLFFTLLSLRMRLNLRMV